MSGRSKRLLAFVVAIAMAALTFVGAGSASAAPAVDGDATAATAAAAPVTGTADDGSTFSGTFTPTSFASQNGKLLASGDLTGTLTHPDGSTEAVSRSVTMPVDAAASTGSCQILDLVLGPLDLDLLGLTVHLDTVHLNITAEQGPGNLLGNLLCAIAGLLDQNTGLDLVLSQIANLLNQILAILG